MKLQLKLKADHGKCGGVFFEFRDRQRDVLNSDSNCSLHFKVRTDCVDCFVIATPARLYVYQNSLAAFV